MMWLFALPLAMGSGCNQVFTGRAALLHLGAVTATIVMANVCLITIANQKVVVADPIARKAPDPKHGKIAQLRSTQKQRPDPGGHLRDAVDPYPLAFASDWNWLTAGLVCLKGVAIRRFFNTDRAHRAMPRWNWG